MRSKSTGIVLLFALSLISLSLPPTQIRLVHGVSCPTTGAYGTIEGCVVNYDTGSPVSGLSVWLVACPKVTFPATTDSNGYFSFQPRFGNGSTCLGPNTWYTVSVNGVTTVSWTCCDVLGQGWDLPNWGQWVGDVQTDGSYHASTGIIQLDPARQVLVPAATLFTNTQFASLGFSMASSKDTGNTVGVSVSIGGALSVGAGFQSSESWTTSYSLSVPGNTQDGAFEAYYYAIDYYCAGTLGSDTSGFSCTQGIKTAGGTTQVPNSLFQGYYEPEYLPSIPTSNVIDCPVNAQTSLPGISSTTETTGTVTLPDVSATATFRGVGATFTYSRTETSSTSDTTSVTFANTSTQQRTFRLWPATSSSGSCSGSIYFGPELHVWDLSGPVDFSMSASPTSLTVLPGSSGTTAMSLAALNGFSGTVSLDTSILPSGVSVSFNPANVILPGSGTSMATITVASSVSSGAGPFTITGTCVTGACSNPSITHSVRMNLQDFGLSVGPSSIVLGCSSSTSLITVASYDGFSGNVGLSASAPSGFSATLDQTTVSLPSNGVAYSHLTVSIAGSPTAGQYPIIVTGSVMQGSHSASVTVIYSSLQICPNPSSLTLTPGTQQSSQLTLQSLNGFSGTVTLTASVSPTVTGGPTTSFSSTSVAVPTGGSATSTLYVTAGSTTGSYSVTVTGTSGNVLARAQVQVGVVAKGGSVAYGTLISMADGSKTPVQNLHAGDLIVVYNVLTGYQTTATIKRLDVVETNTTITLHTSVGLPLRADKNPKMTLWVMTSNGPVEKQIALIRPGDQIYNYDLHRWVAVTSVTLAAGGNHVLYDPIYTPTETTNALLLEFIANGYPDFYTD